MKRIGGFFGSAGLAVLGMGSLLAAAAPGAALASTGGCAGAAAMSTVTATGAASGSGQSVVKDIRVGHHTGCDRVTIEFAGRVPAYTVGYVSKVISDPKGDVVTLDGSAFMRIVLRGTSTSTPAPQPDLKPHFAVLREVRGAGDFEAVTSYGVGLSSKQPFRAYALSAPNRLVIDIASPAGGQVTQVPSGGVATGDGSTSAFPRDILLMVAAALVTIGGATLLVRRQVTARR
jgi:hypothetical protein